MGNGMTCMAQGGVQPRDLPTSRGRFSSHHSPTCAPYNTSRRGSQFCMRVASTAVEQSQSTQNRRRSQTRLSDGVSAAANARPDTPLDASDASLTHSDSSFNTHPPLQRVASYRPPKPAAKRRKPVSHASRTAGATEVETKKKDQANVTPTAPAAAASSAPQAAVSPNIVSPQDKDASEDDVHSDFTLSYDVDLLGITGIASSSPGSDSKDNKPAQSPTAPRDTSHTTSSRDDAMSPWRMFDFGRGGCSPEAAPAGGVRMVSPCLFRGISTTPQLFTPRLSDSGPLVSGDDPSTIPTRRSSPPHALATSSTALQRTSMSSSSVHRSSDDGSRTPALDEFYDSYFNHFGFSPCVSPQGQVAVAGQKAQEEQEQEQQQQQLVIANKSTGLSTDNEGNGAAAAVSEVLQRSEGEPNSTRALLTPAAELSDGPLSSQHTIPPKPLKGLSFSSRLFSPASAVTAAEKGSRASDRQLLSSTTTVTTQPHQPSRISAVFSPSPPPRRNTLPHGSKNTRNTKSKKHSSTHTSARAADRGDAIHTTPAVAPETPTTNRDLLDSSLNQSMPNLHKEHKVNSILRSGSRYRDKGGEATDEESMDPKAASVSFVLAEDQARLAIVSSQRLSLALPRALMVEGKTTVNEGEAMRRDRRV